ncbi:hypothetical protein M8818_003354 [Zalaria obscura]|uniref:Uncharacterized protein n=1 Tax=Zalaria obscura TaxID=2024903 RepID=A0ACC3SFD0_9PEZI
MIRGRLLHKVHQGKLESNRVRLLSTKSTPRVRRSCFPDLELPTHHRLCGSSGGSGSVRRPNVSSATPRTIYLYPTRAVSTFPESRASLLSPTRWVVSSSTCPVLISYLPVAASGCQCLQESPPTARPPPGPSDELHLPLERALQTLTVASAPVFQPVNDRCHRQRFPVAARSSSSSAPCRELQSHL